LKGRSSQGRPRVYVGPVLNGPSRSVGVLYRCEVEPVAGLAVSVGAMTDGRD